jgi:hypothetical protein
VVPGGGDKTVTIDVFATNPDAAENERLNAYTISVEAPTFGGANKPRFVIPGSFAFPDSSAAHPYVFAAFPGNGPVDPAGLSDADTVLLSAALGGTGQEANISETLNGFAQLTIMVPEGTLPGEYAITIPQPEQGGFLSLGSAGASITAIGAPGILTVVVPEPASLGLVAIGGLLALRRRRVA